MSRPQRFPPSEESLVVVNMSTLSLNNSSSTWIESTSTQPQTCPKQDLSLKMLTSYYTDIAVLSLIFIVAMVGNLSVLFAVWRRRAKSTRMHLFIVHLACADIVVALFEVLPELIFRFTCEFLASDVVCRLVKYLQIVGMYGSTYVLVCTAMDRYLAIRYPMRTFKQSKKRVHMTIFLAWLLSFLLSTPQLFFWKINYNGSRQCGMPDMSVTSLRIYVTWHTISVLLFPVALLAFFYGMIAWIIFKNLKQKKQAATTSTRTLIRQGQDFAPRASNFKMVSQAKLKTVKMTFVIVLLYAFCYMPFFIVSLLGVWNLIDRNDLCSQIIHLLAPLNSCVNPWVYMAFSGHLLDELKQAFCCRKQTQETQQVRSFRCTVATNLGSSSMYADTSHQQATETTNI